MLQTTPQKYCAFISYRHLDADRRCAEWLVNAIETFKVPKALQMQGYPAKLGRVFRDRDELPSDGSLNEQIEAALQESRVLIVVCSPETPASRWVSREIEIFKELGRAEKILPVLISGDPSISFPPVLTTTELVSFDNTKHINPSQTFEPIGADFRPLPGHRRRDVYAFELLRIIAVILGCSFDDLRQRDLERNRNRRIRYFATGAALTVLVLSLYTGMLLSKTRELNGERSTFLAEISRLQIDAVVSDTDQDKGQYDRAIRYAMLATETGFLWPQTPDGFDQLVRALQSAPKSREYNTPDRSIVAAVAKPDFTRMVVVDDHGQIVVFNLSGEVVDKFEGPTGQIGHLLSYHPNLNQVVLSMHGGELHVIDLESRKTILKVPALESPVFGASFSPDGSYLLVWRKNQFHVWRLEDAVLIDEQNFYDLSIITAQWILNENKVLFHLKSEDYVGSIVIRDVTQSHSILNIGNSDASVQAVAIDRNGRQILIHKKNGGVTENKYTVDVVDYPTFYLKRSIKAGIEKFDQLEISPDGKYFAGVHGVSFNGHETIHVFDIKRGSRIRSIQAANSPVNDFDFGPGYDQIITTHENGTIRVWNIRGGSTDREEVKFQGHNGQPIAKIYVFPKGKKIYSLGNDGSFISWDASGKNSHLAKLAFDGTPEVMKFSGSGNSLLALSDAGIALVDLKYNTDSDRNVTVSASQILKLRNGGAEVVYLGWANDDKTIVVLFASGEVALIEPINKKVESYKFKFSNFATVSADSKNKRVAFVSEGALYFSSPDLKAVKKVSDLKSDVDWELLFSNDGDLLLLGSSGGLVEIWDAESGSRLYSYQDSKSRRFMSGSFSNDNKKVAFSTRTDGARVLDISSLMIDELAHLNKEYLSSISLLFHPDGSQLYVAGPTRMNGFDEVTVGSFDLANRHYKFMFAAEGIDSLLAFYGSDRLAIGFNSLSSRQMALVSPKTGVEVASVPANRFSGGMVIEPNRRIVATGSYGAIELTDLRYALEYDKNAIRDFVCDVSSPVSQLVITDLDVRIVPVIRKRLGRNVCTGLTFF